MSEENKAKGPSHYIKHVKQGNDGKYYENRVGAAFEQENGDFILDPDMPQIKGFIKMTPVKARLDKAKNPQQQTVRDHEQER